MARASVVGRCSFHSLRACRRYGRRTPHTDPRRAGRGNREKTCARGLFEEHHYHVGPRPGEVAESLGVFEIVPGIGANQHVDLATGVDYLDPLVVIIILAAVDLFGGGLALPLGVSHRAVDADPIDLVPRVRGEYGTRATRTNAKTAPAIKRRRLRGEELIPQRRIVREAVRWANQK